MGSARTPLVDMAGIEKTQEKNQRNGKEKTKTRGKEGNRQVLPECCSEKWWLGCGVGKSTGGRRPLQRKSLNKVKDDWERKSTFLRTRSRHVWRQIWEEGAEKNRGSKPPRSLPGEKGEGFKIGPPIGGRDAAGMNLRDLNCLVGSAKGGKKIRKGTNRRLLTLVGASSRFHSRKRKS